MEPAPLVPFGSPEYYHIDSGSAADSARACFPRCILQNLAVNPTVIFPAVEDLLVGIKAVNHTPGIDFTGIVTTQSLQASPLKPDRFILRHAASLDARFKLRISVDLRNADRGIGPVRSVIVVPVVFKCLPERGCAIKTGHAERSEIRHVTAPRDSQEMKLRPGGADGIDPLEASENLMRLEGDHAAKSDARIADRLQGTDSGRVRCRTPPLGDRHGGKARLPAPASGQELLRQVKRQLLAGLPLLELRMIRAASGRRIVSEDDVIDGDAEVKAAFVVEVDDLVRPVRGNVVVDIAEGTTIAHGHQGFARSGVEAEEPPDSGPVEAMPLGQGVFPGGTGPPVNDRLGHQEAVYHPGTEGLMDVEVISLPDPQG